MSSQPAGFALCLERLTLRDRGSFSAPILIYSAPLPLVNDCIGLRLSNMGDKTQKDKQKRTHQHEAKRKAAERDKREATETQQHPVSGHPATAEHPASSGPVAVKEK
jgi:hypothetical protein